MALSPELMQSILAMDSYNRGYDPGMLLTGNEIGNATIFLDSVVFYPDPNDPNRVDQAFYFYGVACKLNSGETIVSYRGTGASAGFPPMLGSIGGCGDLPHLPYFLSAVNSSF